MITKDSVKIVVGDKEQDIANLVNSGAIPPIGQITDAQSAILIMLAQQNVNQSQTNAKLFEKLDKAAEKAEIAAEAAHKASEKAEIAAHTGEEVKNQFITLNGRVSNTIERVASLEGIRELAVKEDEKRILLRQGMKYIPTKVYNFLTICGQILLGILSITGAAGSIWWIFIQIANHLK